MDTRRDAVDGAAGVVVALQRVAVDQSGSL